MLHQKTLSDSTYYEYRSTICSFALHFCHYLNWHKNLGKDLYRECKHLLDNPVHNYRRWCIACSRQESSNDLHGHLDLDYFLHQVCCCNVPKMMTLDQMCTNHWNKKRAVHFLQIDKVCRWHYTTPCLPSEQDFHRQLLLGTKWKSIFRKRRDRSVFWSRPSHQKCKVYLLWCLNYG